MSSRQPEVPVDDYDLDSLKQIQVRDFTYYVMPRYLEHYAGGDYEPFSADLWLRYIQPGDTVADVGGHFGFYSLLAAQKAGARGQVITLEPVPVNAQVLAKNAAANQLADRITIHNKAASDKNGTHSFNVPWASDSAGFYEHPNAATIKKINVETVNLDTLLSGKKVSMVKIDTEGHEIAVLRGADRFFKANPQVRLVVEFNPDCLITANHKPIELLQELQQRGFAIYIINESTRQLDRVSGRLNQWESLMAGREYANLLCLPQASAIDMVVVSHVSEIEGGAELTMISQLGALQQQGVISHVVLPGHGSLEEKLRELAISYEVTPMLAWARIRPIKPDDLKNEDYVNTRATENLYQLLEMRRPDIVYTNTMVMPWGALAAAAARIPHLWSVQEFGDKDHHSIFDYPYEQTLSIIDMFSQHVEVVSKAVRSHIAQVIPSRKMSVVYVRVQPPSQATPGERTHRVFKRAHAAKIVIASRIEEAKGQLDAVEAARILIEKGHDIELRLVGRVRDKAYLKKIKDYVKAHKLTGHVFIDNFTLKAYEYFEEADIVLVCSRNEAFGRVTAEGMMYEKLVIGTDTGGTPEMITDGATGFLYPPGNSKELAKHIEFAVRRPGAARDIAREGKLAIQHLLSEANTHQKLYRILLDIRNNPQPAAPLFFEKLVPRFSQIVGDQDSKIKHEIEQNLHRQKQITELIQQVAWLQDQLINEQRKFKMLRKIARLPGVRQVQQKVRKHLGARQQHS